MRVLGSMLFIIGLLGLAYFIFGFETSVSSPSGGTDALTSRVGNLGLQNDRVCGSIGGAALMITGAVLSSAGEVQKTLQAILERP